MLGLDLDSDRLQKARRQDATCAHDHGIVLERQGTVDRLAKENAELKLAVRNAVDGHLKAAEERDKMQAENDRLRAERNKSPHDLKCWPGAFQAILDGTKRFEIRSTKDRVFRVGDTLRLREYVPSGEACDEGHTGRSVEVRVIHIAPGGEWGLPADLCVMGIEKT
jgi:hypothetical protein